MAAFSRGKEEERKAEGGSYLNLPTDYEIRLLGKVLCGEDKSCLSRFHVRLELGEVLDRVSDVLVPKALCVLAKRITVPKDYTIPEIRAFEDYQHFKGNHALLNLTLRCIELDLKTLTKVLKKYGRNAVEQLALSSITWGVISDLHPDWDEKRCKEALSWVLKELRNSMITSS